MHEREPHTKVGCSKLAVEVAGEVARVAEVKVGWEERNYCLARTPRWQVLRHVKGVPCFPTPPEDRTRAVTSENERVVAAVTAQFTARLEGIRQAMASQVRPRKCAGVASSNHSDVPVLEFELLQQDSGVAGWEFLSTPWLRAAVLERGNTEGLLEAAEKWRRGRPWVAVVTSATREPASAGIDPQLHLRLPTFWQRGRLTGTLSLIDAEAGALLCEAPFSFESSQTLPSLPILYGKRDRAIAPILDIPTEARVHADFEARFHSAVMTTLNEMTAFKVWPALY